jgi:hypothetical protein
VAEAALHSGELAASSDYGQGYGPTVRIVFDLGNSARPMRMHVVATYRSQDGEHTIERITIGREAWERSANGEWRTIAEQEGVWGQIRAYLPQLEAARRYYGVETVAPDTLAWHDSARNMQVTVRVDPQTGVPISMTQHVIGAGVTTTVAYTSWNAPVVIEPPDQAGA